MLIIQENRRKYSMVLVGRDLWFGIKGTYFYLL